MKKIWKISASIFCVLLIVTMLAPNVSADTTKTVEKYDPYTEGIVSSYYTVDTDKGYITGIAPGTTAEQLQKVCLPAQLCVSQTQLATGTVLTAQVSAPEQETEPPAEETTGETTVETTEDTTEVTTGEATEPTNEQASRKAEASKQTNTDLAQKTYKLTVIVTGDLNGDGNVTITDMLMLKNAILGKKLTDTAAAAGDVNYDGSVSITDFLRIKAELLGLEKITSGRKTGTVPEDPLLLLTPKEQVNWAPDVNAANFAVSDESLATVAQDGTITAGTEEGTAFVYALDSESNVLDRAVITVLKDKLSVSLDVEACRILAGKTQKLTARLNHPVTATVTWSSSDPAIASVDSTGKVSAHKSGKVTVKATLENGSTATTSVTVVPPITAVETEKTLYKVKPGKSRTITLELTPAGVEEEFTWTSSDPSIAKVSKDGIVTGVKYGTVTITAKGKYSGLTASCKVKVCDVKQVAITFDDGPSPYTEQLLDYLKKNDIKVTFFLVGNRLSSYPETLKRQVAEGHEIGYHSYAHVEQTTLSSAQIISDFEKSEAMLKKITGAEFTLWRTPGGGYSDRVLNCVDLPHIMWSVDTYDWQVRDTYTVYRQIVNQSKDGSIILLHDLYSFSVNGAIKAMTEMQAGDYEFVTVSELLGRNGTPPAAHKTYYSG